MEVLYIYCSSCGYEAFDQWVGFSRTTAGNGDKGVDWYYCPSCKCETSNVVTGEEEEPVEIGSTKVHRQIHYKEYSEVDMISNLCMSRELASRLVELGITMDKLKGSK